jgi:hypothetical protein
MNHSTKMQELKKKNPKMLINKRYGLIHRQAASNPTMRLFKRILKTNLPTLLHYFKKRLVVRNSKATQWERSSAHATTVMPYLPSTERSPI